MTAYHVGGHQGCGRKRFQVKQCVTQELENKLMVIIVPILTLVLWALMVSRVPQLTLVLWALIVSRVPQLTL